MPQRWIVERSFVWIEKCRSLWKNCERKLNTSFQFIHLAFLILLLKGSKRFELPRVPGVNNASLMYH